MSVNLLFDSKDFENWLKKSGLLVAHFMADWAPQCQQINDVMEELTKSNELMHVTFVKIMAEDFPNISQKFNVTAVPTVLLFVYGDLVDKIDGAKTDEVVSKIKVQGAKSLLLCPPVEEFDLNERLKKLINSSKCVLFMKGTPSEPKCGFSKKTINLLNKYETEFSHFDILSDEKVRQGLKTYSNWPTFPQLYVNGELIGGLDILKDMDESNELNDILPRKVSLEERLKLLINKSAVMVFMKGSPSSPKCGFSKQLMAILHLTGVPFETFDILSDEEIRQGLKTFSKWPTYPQIYVKGELVGGLDIIKELQDDGSLVSTLKGD